MRLIGTTVNHTPGFLLPVTGKGWWERVWGAVELQGKWLLPACYPFGEWVLNDLQALRVAYELDEVAEDHVRRLSYAKGLRLQAEKSYAAGRAADLPLPEGFRFSPKYQPFKHQRLGMAYLLACYRWFFLWEMGTGKTKTIVDGFRLLKAHGKVSRMLVVAPKVVLPTWRDECYRHSEGELKVALWNEDTERDQFLEEAVGADVVVISYPRARQEDVTAQVTGQPNVLHQIPYEMFVGDESHNMGSYESQQTHAGMQLAALAGRRYLLSGTAADHPAKLYPQLRLLSSGLMPLSWTAFQKHHFEYDPSNKHLIKKFKWVNELNAKVDTIASRMKKKDCLDLPPLTVTDLPFDLGPRQKARYNELVLEMKASFEPILSYAGGIKLTDDEGEAVEAEEAIAISPEDVALVDPEHQTPMFAVANGAVRVAKLSQLTSGYVIRSPDITVCNGCPNLIGCAKAKIKPYTKRCEVLPKKPTVEIVRDVENPKLETFEALLRNILEADPTNKVLCWGNYTPELDDMEAVVKKLKVGHIRIDGKTTKNIEAMQLKFETDPKCRVSVGQNAAGVGITLVAANFTIYYNLPWNAVHYRQSLARNDRPGQVRNITAYRLIAKDTITEYVAASLNHKELVSYTLLERIACSQCKDQRRCASEGNRPFRDGCLYQPSINRPRAKVEVVK